MEIKEKIYNNEKYYFINEYKFKFGIIYKFANLENTIFCTKVENDFCIITDKKMLNKIKKEFEKIKIKDIV